MIALLVISFVAGLLAGVSPCVLPVLPVVFASWSASPSVENQTERLCQRRNRALAVVAGLAVSFSTYILAGKAP